MKKKITAAYSILLLVAVSLLAAQVRVPGPGGKPAAAAGNNIVFTSFKTGSATGPALTVATSSTMNVAAADLVVACIGLGENAEITSNLTSVSDGGSNTMTCPGTSAKSASVGSIGVCYKENATANATATWTATWTGNRTFMNIDVVNLSGAAASALDQGPACNASGCATATTANTRSGQDITTVNANDLLLACSYDGNMSTYTGANSFVIRGSAGSTDHNVATKNVTATGTYPSGNWATNSGSVAHVSQFISFKSN